MSNSFTECDLNDAWSDDFLLCFLRARKLDVNRALKVVII